MKPTPEALKAAKEIRTYLAAAKISPYIASTVTESTEQIEQRIAQIIDKEVGLPELLEHFHRPVWR